MTTYSTGTVSIGANSTSLSGTGTAWSSSGVRPGDMLLLAGNIVPITSVNSNTGITLARPWPGTAQSGTNYDILLIDDDVRTLVAANMLLQQLTGGTLTSLAGLASAADKMPYFSGVNVMALTDLTSQARSLLGSDRISVSGNNIVTPGTARLTGGVVTTSATDPTGGRVMRTGDWYMSGQVDPVVVDDGLTNPVAHMRYKMTAGADRPPNEAVVVSRARGQNNQWAEFAQRLGFNGTARAWLRHQNSPGNIYGWVEILTTGNTTVDSNGFVKAASPILRLFGDGSIEEPVQPTGAEVARISAGLYQISGTLGLAQEGWQIEVPRDHNGNRLCFVAAAWADDVLTVTVSEPLWQDGRWIAGDPIDVPTGRWIDIRLHEEPIEEHEPEPEES